jgi:hypothetical protein
LLVITILRAASFTAKDGRDQGGGKEKARPLDRDAVVGAGRATTPYTVRLDCAEKDQNQNDD